MRLTPQDAIQTTKHVRGIMGMDGDRVLQPDDRMKSEWTGHERMTGKPSRILIRGELPTIRKQWWSVARIDTPRITNSRICALGRTIA